MSNVLKALARGGAVGDYQISRSLRFNSADSAYLSRTPASNGSLTTVTFSYWLKRSALANGTASRYHTLYSAAFNWSSTDTLAFDPNDKLLFSLNGSSGGVLTTTQVFRDVSSWYHIVVAVDTTQATASNRIKIYVNGEQITSFAAETYPSEDYNFVKLNRSTYGQAIGYAGNSGATGESYFDGYFADIHFIDGAALTADSFGEVNEITGVWTPIKFAGPYNVGTGVNGFHLEFADNSDVTATTLGKDTSGNGNNWTPSGSPGFSVTAGAGNDSLVDVPTRNTEDVDTGAGGEVRGNYATLNALNNGNILANGNLEASFDSGFWRSTSGTIGMSSGKWYWEVVATGAYINHFVGIAKEGFPLTNYLGVNALGWSYRSSNGSKYNNGAATAYGATWTTNDVIGVAFDADAGTLTFYKNGSSQGTAFTGLTSGPYFPALSNNGTSGTATLVANFGQRPFAHTAPSGFKALVTTNLPDPTVVQGDDYFNTVLYEGNGTGQSITGVGFQPDWVWIKSVSDVDNNVLQDAVRGVTKQLFSNLTDAETNFTNGVTSFDSDGFTVATSNWSNESGETRVAWNWKANGAGSSNTAGSIPSTVSANTTAGISIVTYTGTGANATVGHGLGVAPAMIIVKRRDDINNWRVGHNGLTSWSYRINLESTDAESSQSNVWNDTSPTSSEFSIGTSSSVNVNTGTYVAYCFAEVEGFSKFGSYTGNGSADGTFVYTGFRPAWVMVKCSSSDQSGNAAWRIHDTTRNPSNVVTFVLFANQTDAQGDSVWMDILSNGFKIRTTSTGLNASGATYIFAAFAENPFKNALAR